MTARFRHADVRGARLAWNSTGTGSPVVWAHGMSASSYVQESAGQFDWRPVSAEHRLIRYDARGHGRSSGTPDPTSYTWPELGADLLGLLETLTNMTAREPVSAIGSSMGSASILCAALAEPDRFDRLVLTTPPTLWETRAAQAAGRRAAADFVEQHGLAALERATPDVPASPALAQARRFTHPVQVRASLFPSVLRGSAMTDLPDPATVATLRPPALVLCWTGDPTHPVSSAERLAEILGAPLHVADTPARLREFGRLAADFLR